MAENTGRTEMFKAAEGVGLNLYQFEKVLSVFTPEQLASAKPEDLDKVFFFLDINSAQKISAFMRIWLGNKTQRGFWEIVWPFFSFPDSIKQKLVLISLDKFDKWEEEELTIYASLLPHETPKIFELFKLWKKGLIQ